MYKQYRSGAGGTGHCVSGLPVEPLTHRRPRLGRRFLDSPPAARWAPADPAQKKPQALPTCGHFGSRRASSPRQATTDLAATAAAGGRSTAARLAARGLAARRRTAATTAAATQLVAEVTEAAAAARGTARGLAAARSSTARGLTSRGTAAGLAGRSTAARLATTGGAATATATAAAAAVIAAAAAHAQHAIEQLERTGVLRRRNREARGQRQDGKRKSNLHGEGSFTNTQVGGIRGNFPLLPGRIVGTLSKALVGQTAFRS